jgi:gluconate 2-dehydrogenase gamma chain
MSTGQRDESRLPGAVSRRAFGKFLGLAGAAHAVPALEGLPSPPTANSPAAAASAEAAQAPARASSARAFTFFTPDEAAFVEAAIDRIIPADDLGPGAADADVAIFIDRQLAGAYGSGGKWYMRGPWGQSAREQGYQLPLTPQQLYRLAIAEVDRHVTARQGRPFSQLPASERDALLREMDSGTLAIDGVDLKTFFEMLLGNTMEGFFSDPVHGGNRDKAGWRLVGFPGVAASYLSRVGRYNEPYRVEPVGIADVLEGRARQDEHGHVIHEPLEGGPDPKSGVR